MMMMNTKKKPSVCCLQVNKEDYADEATRQVQIYTSFKRPSPPNPVKHQIMYWMATRDAKWDKLQTAMTR